MSRTPQELAEHDIYEALKCVDRALGALARIRATAERDAAVIGRRTKRVVAAEKAFVLAEEASGAVQDAAFAIAAIRT